MDDLKREVITSRVKFSKEVQNRVKEFKNDFRKNVIEIKDRMIADVNLQQETKITQPYMKYRITKKSNDIVNGMYSRVRRRDQLITQREEIQQIVFYYGFHSPYYLNLIMVFIFNQYKNEYEMIVKFFSSAEIHQKIKRKAVFILLQILVPFLIFVEQYIYHFHIVKDMVQQQNAKEIRPM